MMAFFLLMWLLGSTTEGDKKGIADYFNSPLKVAFFGGQGAGDAGADALGGTGDQGDFSCELAHDGFPCMGGVELFFKTGVRNL
jgi:hypothetical protein